MTKSLIALFLLSGALATTACTPNTNQSREIAGELTSSNGIVGGVGVEPTEEVAKSTVQIMTFIVEADEKGVEYIRGMNGCTGTLIEEDILLTAAHCTAANASDSILYFSTDMPKDMKEFLKTVGTNPLVRNVKGAKVAALWPKLTDRKEKNWGDIALMKFEGGIPKGYKVASLLPKSEALTQGQAITLAGYGLLDGVREIRSDRLMKVEVSILNPKFSMSEMLLDTGDKGACHGDSGGPAYVTGSDGIAYVAGVTSRADFQTDPQGRCIGETVYTKTQPYMSWIAKATKLLQAEDYVAEPVPQPQGE